MSCLAFLLRIHGGYADKIIFFCVKFNGWIAHFHRDPDEFCFALRIGIDTHIELVCADKSPRHMNINKSRENRLAVSTAYVELNGAGTGSAVSDGCLVWFWRLR